MPGADSIAAYRHTIGDSRAAAKRLEEILVDVFAEVLNLESLGLDDSFFDLGGDSLSALRATAMLSAALDTRIGVTDLVNAPSVRGLSKRLADMPTLSDIYLP
ncbi:phosphopantetheine-binding protein [Mycobacterium sp. 1274761.0]|uniref:phosphopantetheine-binding protein n=1 Tax=Mycobacterium sp. 1274761.0 TaxID=1834077 RepID=UPI00350EDFED